MTRTNLRLVANDDFVEDPPHTEVFATSRSEEAPELESEAAGNGFSNQRFIELIIDKISESRKSTSSATVPQANAGPGPELIHAELNTKLDQLGKAVEDCVKFVSTLKSHTDQATSQVPLQPETAHNPPMTEVTRELLDAKLDSVRAEVRASIAESSKETVAAMGQLNTQMATMQGQMLTEMQGLRADFANMLKDVTKEMAATGVAVATVGGKVDGLEGKVDGLKSSINMLQFVVGTVVAVAAIIIGILQYDIAKNPPATAAPAAAVTQPPK